MMTDPTDDPLWPRCEEHNALGGTLDGLQHWCDWTRSYLEANNDAQAIEPGLRYCVPIAAETYLYAEVSVDPEEIISGMHQLYLVQEVTNTLDENLVAIGTWSKGEGRVSMALALYDWAYAVAADTCRSSSHGIGQQYKWRHTGGLDWYPNAWCLALFKMCHACYIGVGNQSFGTPDYSDPTAYGLPASAFRNGITTGNSGLNGNVNTVGPQSTPERSHADQVRDKLKERFNRNGF